MVKLTIWSLSLTARLPRRQQGNQLVILAQDALQTTSGSVKDMDLEIARERAGESSQWARLAAVICFALTCGLLAGTLLKPLLA
jgi:hypothetical protein